MTDKTDETARGPSGPNRPGDAPKRPYATIDLQATEVGRDGGKEGGRTATPGSGKPEAAPRALPPPGRERRFKPERLAAASAAAWATFASGLSASRRWVARLVHGNGFLSHTTAGVAGAMLTLAVAALLGLLSARQAERATADVARRLAEMEKVQQQRSAALPADVAAKVADAATRLARIEERVQATQAKLAADAKAIESLDARIPAGDMAERLGKLEAALTAASNGDKAGSTASESEQSADLAALKAEAGSLRQSIEAVKGSVDERLKDTVRAGDVAQVSARLAAVERGLQAIAKTEGDRAASSRQVLLTLEIANLKRALDRGDSYARELEAARKAAGDSVDLTPLIGHSLTGVPPLATLTQEFRRVANASLDAEAERPDAGVLDRLMAGARSVVRLRKASHDADDVSAEATLGRMEAALKEGNIGEVLAQGKRLPPRAALAAEDWLRRLEARYTADRAVADIEAGLKASLAAQRASVSEPKR